MDETIDTACQAHKKVMASLVIFHLVLPVLAFFSGWYGVILSLTGLGALLSLAWLYWHAYAEEQSSAFVARHWQQSWRRCRWLLLAYCLSLVIVLVGYLLSLSQPDHQIEEFMWLAYSRVAIMPTFLTALALFVMESVALVEARKGVK